MTTDQSHQERFNLPENGRVPLEWLSTADAAKYLSISENALRIQVFRGQIKSYKLGRQLRFRLDELRQKITNSQIRQNRYEIKKGGCR